jgi:DNA polymerase-1
MLKAFQNDEDLHSQTALEIFNLDCPVGEIAERYPKYRSMAKTINFGIVYGVGPKGLMAQIDGISFSEAADAIDSWFELYPEVRDFMFSKKRECQSKRYVTTFCGRRRRLIDEYGNRNFGWERAAANAPIQGTGAELMKVAMVAINREFKKHNIDARLVLQVHDEVIAEARKDQALLVANVIKRCMENSFRESGYILNVPIKADPTFQTAWGIKAVMN